LRIKLDENLSRHLKSKVSDLGYEVETVYDENLEGVDDTTIGSAAKAEGRVLFTQDIEFADLRKYPPGTHPGIILFRGKTRGPILMNQLVLNFLEKYDLSTFAKCVVVVEEHQIRIRRPSS